MVAEAPRVASWRSRSYVYRHRLWRVVVYAVPLTVSLFMIIPLVYMLIVSVQHLRFLPGAPSRWLTQAVTLDTYRQVLTDTNMVRWLFNSLLVAGVVSLVGTALAAAAGYAFFVNRRNRGVSILFGLVLLGMMIPRAVTIIPLFLMVRDFHLLNSYLALILPPLGLPIGVFLVRQAMFSFPMPLIDAARIDGASEFRAFRTIVLPILGPTLAVVGILIFMEQWREFIWPLIVTSRSEMATVPVGGAALSAEFTKDWGIYMAGAALAVLPGVAVFLIFQRWLIKGISAGALEG